MKLLNIRAIGCVLIALTTLAASAVSAQITLQKSGDPRDQLSRCSNSWECYKEEQIEKEKAAAAQESAPWWLPFINVEVYRVIPVLTIDMPNLVAKDVDGKIRAAGVGIKAEVKNEGTVNSGDFDYKAVVTFVKVDDGSTTGPFTVQTRVPSLQPTEGWDDYLGWVPPPSREYAYDVHMTVTADSIDLQNGGEVRESSEDDNVLMATCRMAGTLSGQNIAGSVPACQ